MAVAKILKRGKAMSKEAIEILKKSAHKLEIELNEAQLTQFETYLNFLIQYNEHTNLTSITEPNQIVIKHFLDSLLLTKAVKIVENSKIADIGTGAGFPGVPVKIVCPKIKLSLIDSLNKRLVFLSQLSEKLNLNYEIIHRRAEECGKDLNYREKFDIVTSRAVASFNILAEYCLPYVKVGGVFAALKGPNVEDEIDGAKDAICKLGGKIEAKQYFDLPDGSGKRNIIIAKKIKNTPPEYPRQGVKIAKKPL